jgi:hypothetical protein
MSDLTDFADELHAASVAALGRAMASVGYSTPATRE